MDYCYSDFANQSVKTRISNCCCDETQNQTNNQTCNCETEQKND